MHKTILALAVGLAMGLPCQAQQIYSAKTLNNFSYTPEQWEQIRASQIAAAGPTADFNSSDANTLIVADPVQVGVAPRQSIHVYSRDAMDIIHSAEPGTKVRAQFTASQTTTIDIAKEGVKRTNQKEQEENADDYTPKLRRNRQDGVSWGKIYRGKTSELDSYGVRPEDMTKGLKDAIDESKRLRSELSRILGVPEASLELEYADKPPAVGGRFHVSEDRALDNPNKLAYPENTLYLSFDEAVIYDVKICAGKTTDIRLREFERIKDITLGNQDNLEIDGYLGQDNAHNHITIKPFDQGISTRMRVLTNYGTYLFQLTSATPEEFNPNVLFKLGTTPPRREPYSNPLHGPGSAQLKRSRRETKPIEVMDPNDLNFDYFIKGEKYNPQYVWDDGRFTYVLLPKRAYNHPIHIIGMIENKVTQIREFEIQDDFMKLYGTWSKLRLKINDKTIEIENNNFIPA